MAKTIVENQVCEACQEEVLPEALYCYNCGGSVSAEALGNNDRGQKVPPLKRKKKQAELFLVKDKKEVGLDSPETANDAEPALQDDKLRTAASIRNRARRLDRQKVEIIWEENGNAPNAWFIGVALLLGFFAFVLFLLSKYLK